MPDTILKFDDINGQPMVNGITCLTLAEALGDTVGFNLTLVQQPDIVF